MNDSYDKPHMIHELQEQAVFPNHSPFSTGSVRSVEMTVESWRLILVAISPISPKNAYFAQTEQCSTVWWTRCINERINVTFGVKSTRPTVLSHMAIWRPLKKGVISRISFDHEWIGSQTLYESEPPRRALSFSYRVCYQIRSRSKVMCEMTPFSQSSKLVLSPNSTVLPCFAKLSDETGRTASSSPFISIWGL